jgi:release factor glutamine methyltransferase
VTVSSPSRVDFGPLEVHYDERVLAPRRWTIAQSEWAAALAALAGPGPVLELCAGAGHIGLCAAVLADRDLVQVEADPVAAQFARENAARAGWSDRVEIRCGRLQDVLVSGERWPLVIADPPYITTDDCGRFPEDPRTAIDGGADGLDLVRACLAAGADHLEPGGPLLLQLGGPAQAGLVTSIAEEHGLAAEQLRVIDPERAVLLLRRT